MGKRRSLLCAFGLGAARSGALFAALFLFACGASSPSQQSSGAAPVVATQAPVLATTARAATPASRPPTSIAQAATQPPASDIEIAWDRSVSNGQFPNCSERGTIPGQSFLFRVTNYGVSIFANSGRFKATATDGIVYQGGSFVGTVGGIAELAVNLNRGETGRGWVCFQIPRGIGITRIAYEGLTGRSASIDFRWP